MTSGSFAANMNRGRSNKRKVVVAHAGARDNYQVALALQEVGMLERLVTDLYWPDDRVSMRAVREVLPKALQSLLLQRNKKGLPGSRVSLCALHGMRTLLFDKIPRLPFSARRDATRSADSALGRSARNLAQRSNSDLLSYSYTAYDAFSSFQGAGKILFQAHPHPTTIRRILQRELEAHPDCASSLLQEWELALPDDDYQRLVQETTMASHYLVASTFTQRSLVENGIPADAIRIIPYGVDVDHFQPGKDKPISSKLKLLFVGRINQRKGIKYLLEALDLVDKAQIEVTVCGRVVDGLELFKKYEGSVLVRPSVSNRELLEAYQQADLFVFPSVAEGFGQVLLEAMASGLPVLSTTSTAAPDLIGEGEGLIVQPGDSEALASKISWALENREQLRMMGLSARLRSLDFTWPKFRQRLIVALEEMRSQ